jgi:hypothetical protein
MREPEISAMRYILPVLLISCFAAAYGQSKKNAKTKTKPPVSGILFIKIKSTVFNNLGTATDIKQRIEDKIDDELEATKNGEWLSGDIGPGENNLLLKVKNIDLAVKSVLKILAEEKFIKSVLIGLRVSGAPNHWNYKVIYPKAYKGNF